MRSVSAGCLRGNCIRSQALRKRHDALSSCSDSGESGYLPGHFMVKAHSVFARG